jgi:hypothetical protein
MRYLLWAQRTEILISAAVEGNGDVAGDRIAVAR